MLLYRGRLHHSFGSEDTGSDRIVGAKHGLNHFQESLSSNDVLLGRCEDILSVDLGPQDVIPNLPPSGL